MYTVSDIIPYLTCDGIDLTKIKYYFKVTNT